MLWRQRVSPTTFDATGSPELMTPGADSAFFPTVARQRLGFVGVHSDTNMWSVGIDLQTGIAPGATSTSDPRRRHRQQFQRVARREYARVLGRRTERRRAAREGFAARHRRDARWRRRRQSRVSGDRTRQQTARVRNAGRRTARQTSGVRGESRGRSVPVDLRRLRRPSAALARRRSAACRDLGRGSIRLSSSTRERARSTRSCRLAIVVCRTLVSRPMGSGWRSTPRGRVDLLRARGAARRRSRGRQTAWILADAGRAARSGRETDACSTTCRRRRRLISATEWSLEPSIHSTAASEQRPSTCFCFQR